jgi:hypothetical protein
MDCYFWHRGIMESLNHFYNRLARCDSNLGTICTEWFILSFPLVQILVTLSRLAMSYKTYLVANVQEVLYCNDTSEYCPYEDDDDDKYYLFNTNVVFDRTGAVINRQAAVFIYIFIIYKDKMLSLVWCPGQNKIRLGRLGSDRQPPHALPHVANAVCKENHKCKPLGEDHALSRRRVVLSGRRHMPHCGRPALPSSSLCHALTKSPRHVVSGTK